MLLPTNYKFISPEQFGFRNYKECINLYISIFEICQRKSFPGKFTYVTFLDIKKAYDILYPFSIYSDEIISSRYPRKNL